MAAYCEIINDFVACSDNGLAQSADFFSVNFRDINYNRALSVIIMRSYYIFIPFILEFERAVIIRAMLINFMIPALFMTFWEFITVQLTAHNLYGMR